MGVYIIGFHYKIIDFTIKRGGVKIQFLMTPLPRDFELRGTRTGNTSYHAQEVIKLRTVCTQCTTSSPVSLCFVFVTRNR